MARYTLHLGYTWNSPQIGSIWSTAATPYRFLQYALEDEFGEPAWFQFEGGAELDVMLWQLPSTSPPPAGGTTTLALSMSFGPLVGASTAYNPTSYVTVGSSQAVRSYNNQPYLAFDGISANGPAEGPWGPAPSYSAGKLSLATGAARYKLSFLIKVVNSSIASDPQSYLSDPEVIVGSAG